MKFIVAIFIIICNLYAFQINIDSGIEENRKFSILTLKYNKPFPCNSKIDINNKNILVECIVDKIPSSKIYINGNIFFDIKYQIKNNKLHILIKAKKNQALFANFTDLKRDIPIIKEQPKISKIWQVVGFEDEIPFLSKNTYKGINFPIKIKEANLPTIRELNVDASPLEYNEGDDLNSLLSLETMYKNKQYTEGLQAANDFIETNSNSIFNKDILLYKIRFMDKNNNINSDIRDLSKYWIKTYPTDINVPEVLYIIGNSYGKNKIYNESNYYYNRIIEEYPDSKYSQYALVGVANNIANNGDKKQPPLLYAKAYNKAKDIDTASYVAISWGNWALNNNDNNAAHKLYSMVIDSNKNYFIQDINNSYKEFKKWAEKELYDIAAEAAESLLNNIQNENLKEEIMFNIGEWYELSSNPNKAHNINQQFISNFPNSPNIAKVKIRDDNLLFNVKENDIEKKLAQYDHIIKTYPNTDNSKLALEKKAQTLFALSRYKEVLELKNLLNKNNIAIKESYIKLIEQNNNCDEILRYYTDSNILLITKNAMEVYKCLFNAKLYSQANELSSYMLQNTKTIEDKLEWLYNNANVNYQLRDYNKSTFASRDAFEIAKKLKQKEDIGVTLFLSLANLNRKNEAIAVTNNLLTIFKDKKELLPVYNQLLKWSLESKDNIASEKYAKDIIRIQNKFNLNTYSPFTEFTLSDILFNDNRYSEMLNITKNISMFNLSNDERQKIFYMNGSANYELNNNANAIEEFNKCININKDTAFGTLCNDALGMIK